MRYIIAIVVLFASSTAASANADDLFLIRGKDAKAGPSIHIASVDGLNLVCHVRAKWIEKDGRLYLYTGKKGRPTFSSQSKESGWNDQKNMNVGRLKQVAHVYIEWGWYVNVSKFTETPADGIVTMPLNPTREDRKAYEALAAELGVELEPNARRECMIAEFKEPH